MIFEKDYKILYHDTDGKGVLSPSRLLVYLQETAQAHIMSLGAGDEAMRSRDKEAFWLTRICFDVIKPIRAFDKIKVETWGSDDSRCFSFTRCFRVRRGGETVAQAYSVWALMNIETLRPISVKEWSVPLELEAPIKPSAPLHARLPRDAVYTHGGTRTVTYGDIDVNGHMNNTRYPDVLCGFLPSAAFDGKCVNEMSLSYLHEAADGCTLEGTFAPDPEDDDVYYVRTLISGTETVNAEARIKLKKVTDF